MKPASSVGVGKGEALEVVPGVSASSPAWPTRYLAQAASLPSHLAVPLPHSYSCSCCDLALTHCRDRHNCWKRKQTPSSFWKTGGICRPADAACPSVPQDQSHGPREYLFASWPQSQLGYLDAASTWIFITTDDYLFLLRTLSLHPVRVHWFLRTTFSYYCDLVLVVI